MPYPARIASTDGTVQLGDTLELKVGAVDASVPASQLTVLTASVKPMILPFWGVGLPVALVLQKLDYDVIWVVPLFWILFVGTLLAAPLHVYAATESKEWFFTTTPRAIGALARLRAQLRPASPMSSIDDLFAASWVELRDGPTTALRVNGGWVLAWMLLFPAAAGAGVWFLVALDVWAKRAPDTEHLFVLGLIIPMIWGTWPLPGLIGLWFQTPFARLLRRGQRK